MITFDWSVVIPASVVSAIISGLASYAIAKHTSKSEIRKMKLAWERQDSISDDDAMKKAFASVSLCLHGDGPVYYEQALANVAAILGSYPGKLGQAISDLHSALASSNWDQVEKHYAMVTSLYRQQKTRR